VERTLESGALQPTHSLRVGLGFDAHPLRTGRPLRLGGVTIPAGKGLAGHSDADVLLHALMDAVLGALAQPDIGMLFPDTDPLLEGADSAELTTRVMKRASDSGAAVRNVDCVLVCDQPKLAPFHGAIRTSIAGLLGIAPDAVGLKAKTTEGTALALRSGSIAALVVVLIEVRGR